ncbi:MAG: hypothetical protein AAF944_19470 [Bacteroidota bacterium]
MISDFLSVQQITIHFETLSVPPPYSHRYTFDLKLSPDNLRVQYHLKYTDRGELNEAEIWEEGFSDNDDFSWEGSLPFVWLDTLLAIWQTTSLVSEEEYSEPIENRLFIVAHLGDGQQVVGIPQKMQEWEYLLQELTQAVYEAAHREHPLQIRYLERSAKGEELKLSVIIRFLNRSIKITWQQGKQKQSYDLPWEESKSFLQKLYRLDFHHGYARTKTPNRPDKYLDPGDGRWYPLQKGVTNPGKGNYFGEIIHFLSGLTKASAK